MRRARAVPAMLFDVREALAKLRVGLAQRLFRIHLEKARQIHQDEQQIAESRLRLPPASLCRARLGEFAKLFIQFVEHLVGILPIEANGRRLWS